MQRQANNWHSIELLGILVRTADSEREKGRRFEPLFALAEMSDVELKVDAVAIPQKAQSERTRHAEQHRNNVALEVLRLTCFCL